MDRVFLFALLAALNPTLVAASTLMMLLPHPKQLMFGYLLGALMTSITLGLLIVSSFEESETVETTRNTLSPAATTTLGVIALAVALALASSPRRAAAARRKKVESPARWQRALSKGSPRTAFLVGALLTLPGAAYLTALSRLDKLNYSTAATVVLVITVNVIMLALLEVPLLCFVIAPDWTLAGIERAKAWIARHLRHFAVTALTVLGTLLVIKGLIEFVA